MEELRVNTNNSFWKVALGFFPFYANMQKRLSSEMVQQHNKTKKKMFYATREGDICSQVECKDENDVPDMEELSMGSGWSTESEVSRKSEGEEGVEVPAPPSACPSYECPSDELDYDADESIGALTLDSMSYSASYFNFARTPSINGRRKQHRKEHEKPQPSEKKPPLYPTDVNCYKN